MNLARFALPMLLAACRQDAPLRAGIDPPAEEAPAPASGFDSANADSAADSPDSALETGRDTADSADSAAPNDTGDFPDTADPAPCTLSSVAHLAAPGSSQVAIDVDHREILAPAYDVGSYTEVFDADSFASLTTFPTGARGNPVLVDPVGNHVWVGNPDSGSVTVVERGTHAAVATLTGFVNPQSIVQDPDTGAIFVADHDAGTVTAFDPSTFAERGSATLGVGLRQMSVGDGRLYVPRNDGALDVLDTATLTTIDSITLGSTLYGTAYVPGADRLFVAGFSAGVVYVIEASTLTTLTTLALPNPYQLRVSDDLTHVAVAGWADGSLNLLDSSTGSLLGSAWACSNATDVAEDTATGRWVVTCATHFGLEVMDCR